jgi:hypothetical protein
VKKREITKRERALARAYKNLCIAAEEYREAGCIHASMEVDSYAYEIESKAKRELQKIVEEKKDV